MPRHFASNFSLIRADRSFSLRLPPLLLHSFLQLSGIIADPREKLRHYRATIFPPSIDNSRQDERPKTRVPRVVQFPSLHINILEGERFRTKSFRVWARLSERSEECNGKKRKKRKRGRGGGWFSLLKATKARSASQSPRPGKLLPGKAEKFPPLSAPLSPPGLAFKSRTSEATTIKEQKRKGGRT